MVIQTLRIKEEEVALESCSPERVRGVLPVYYLLSVGRVPRVVVVNVPCMIVLDVGEIAVDFISPVSVRGIGSVTSYIYTVVVMLLVHDRIVIVEQATCIYMV